MRWPAAAIDKAVIRLRQHEARGAVIEGWAAPSTGPRPSVLRLLAGEDLLTVVKATRYSPEAAQAGVRRGWCGFRIKNVAAAAALSDDVKLVCAVSDRVQARWSSAQLLAGYVGRKRTLLNVPEYRRQVHSASGATGLDQILPFALRTQHLHGDHGLVIAFYRWMLQRVPSNSEVADFMQHVDRPLTPGACEKRLSSSEEYLRNRRLLPGPFDPAFPFDTDAFDR